MNKNLFNSNRSTYHDQHRFKSHRQNDQSSDECISSIHESVNTTPLPIRRTESRFSFYDNHTEDECELFTSKWTMVRQRLPDILTLSQTYKPKDIRGQLILLVALMNQQTSQLRRLSTIDYNHNLSRVPTSVIIPVGNRTRSIYLKRIPSEQIIHIDVDGLLFSIPTRQFIIAISRGYAHEATAKYCPSAISDMLINLSKTKVVDEGKQYKRALFKMRMGQMLYLMIFTFFTGMMLALIVSSANTLFKLHSFNYTIPYISNVSLLSRSETEDY